LANDHGVTRFRFHPFFLSSRCVDFLRMLLFDDKGSSLCSPSSSIPAPRVFPGRGFSFEGLFSLNNFHGGANFLSVGQLEGRRVADCIRWRPFVCPAWTGGLKNLKVMRKIGFSHFIPGCPYGSYYPDQPGWFPFQVTHEGGFSSSKVGVVK